MKRTYLTDKQKQLIKRIITGQVIPFIYKNKDGKDCFLDVSASPTLLGNLYFTISIRALIKNKWLFCDGVSKSIDVECLIKGVLDKKKLSGEMVKPTAKAFYFLVNGKL